LLELVGVDYRADLRTLLERVVDHPRLEAIDNRVNELIVDVLV
jgi:hypothetical protein